MRGTRSRDSTDMREESVCPKKCDLCRRYYFQFHASTCLRVCEKVKLPACSCAGVPSRSSRDSPYAIGITDRRTGFLSHVPLQRRKMRGRQQESVAAGGGAPAALTRGFRSGTLSRVTMAAVRAGDVAEVEYSLKKDDGSPFETRFDQV